MTTTPSQPSRKTRWVSEIRGLLVMAAAVLGFHSLIAKPFYIPSESMMPNLLVGDRLVVSKYPYGWSYASASFHLLPPMPGRLFGRVPERGDIVIVTPQDAGRRNEDLIKRVIGLPGDTIQLVGGRIWLNGAPLPTRDMGYRTMPIDGNFHCDADDPDRERAFPGFAGARAIDRSGKLVCRLHVLRETLPGGRSYDTLDFGPSSEDDMPLTRVPAGHVFLLGDNRDNSADSRVPAITNGLGGAVPLEALGGRAGFVSFSLTGDAGWNPLSWPSAFRGYRFAHSLHPDRGPAKECSESYAARPGCQD